MTENAVNIAIEKTVVEISADAENTVKTGSIEEVFEDKTKEDIVQTDWFTFISSKNKPSLQNVNVWQCAPKAMFHCCKTF